MTSGPQNSPIQTHQPPQVASPRWHGWSEVSLMCAPSGRNRRISTRPRWRFFQVFPPKKCPKTNNTSGVLKDGFFGLDEVAQDGWMGFVWKKVVLAVEVGLGWVSVPFWLNVFVGRSRPLAHLGFGVDPRFSFHLFLHDFFTKWFGV